MLYSLLFSLSLLFPVFAVRIPFQVQLTHNITPRGLSVGNTGNAQYVANISIAGNQLPVLLDTGSSDLWVYFAKPPSNPDAFTDTQKPISLSYAVGKATGTAQRATVEFGDYKVQDQAFLLVNDASTFTSDIHSQGYDGLFGLGPNTGSVVRKKLDKKNADTVMQNVFNNANLTRNYITFLLDRKQDPSDPFKGELTISEIIPGFENITTMEKLDVETVTRVLKSDQHWQALTDKDNGITGPDGKVIKVESIVPRAPDGQLVAVIDSGFTFSQVPREVADQIYGRVKGAVYDSNNEWWLVPCGQYLNIAFNFGGRAYPVHPLDVVDDNFNKIDASGKKVCIGSFQPITSAFSLLGHYDMILGMSFLRSVYTLLDFGSWIENGTGDHPFVQMASHTSVAGARSDFISIRLGGNDTIDTDARWQLLPAEQMVSSPVSDEEKKKKYQEMVLSRWPYILIGCLVFIVLVVGLCIWKCCCRKKKDRNALAGNKRLGFGFGKSKKEQDMYDDYAGSGSLKAGGGGNDHRTSYLPLESQAHLPGRYGASATDLSGRPSAQYDQGMAASQQQFNTYHDQYSASNVDLSGGGPQHPQHSYGDYRHSEHSAHSANSGYGQGYSQPPQQGYGGSYADLSQQQQQQQQQGYGGYGGYQAR